MEGWLNFGVLIFVQLLLFLFVAYSFKTKPADLLRTLGVGILIGIPFGLSFDLMLGKFFGLASYVLGFGVSFLIINATLSYGIFTATVLLLRKIPLYSFVLFIIFITAVYEIINIFFRVWIWEFNLAPIIFLDVLITGYLGAAILVRILGRRILK